MQKDLRIREEMQKGMMFRHSAKVEDARLLMGSYNCKTRDTEEIQNLIDDDEEFEDCSLLNDPIQIYQQILETLKKYASAAIKDDYEGWN
jgi:hypothetical protein